MPKLFCIPLYLFPSDHLLFSRWKVIPGVTLTRLTGTLKKTIGDRIRRLPVQLPFTPTHAVLIDEDEYFNALRGRLASEGRQLPSFSPLDPPSLTKQVLISLLLVGRIRFMRGGVHYLEINTKGGRKGYRGAGYSHAPPEGVSPIMMEALGGPVTISRTHLVRMAMNLDRYFRSGIWWTDRLAMALSYFWNALCTPFPDQAFLSLTTALESVLLTQPMEITHTLAERAAVLLGQDHSDRLRVYRQVKDLYRVRSKIVHGKVFAKKGKVTVDSLAITAKQTIVPISARRSLVDLSISVLTRVLAKRDLLTIIQTKKGENKISKELDGFFTKRLLRGR